jgi:SAM-dependent methyltransferase
MSHDCNRHIISEGSFVRDFEGMYRAVADPWDQAAKDADCLATGLAFTVLREVVQPSWRILDIGCASGFHAERFTALAPDVSYCGVDISATVIEQARAARPEHSFHVSDIREFDPALAQGFDLVFSAKTLYYVAPEIGDALANMLGYLRPGGVLAYVYNITPDAFSRQWLTPETLRRKLRAGGLEPMRYVELDRGADEEFVVACFHHVAAEFPLGTPAAQR